MKQLLNSSPPSGAAGPGHRMHWHIIFTHFPISFFSGSFGFQILHLFMAPACFELATNVSLVGGVVSLVPTIWTGWSEWKNRYHGAKGLIFLRKIRMAVGLVVIGVALAVWRIAGYGLFAEARQSPAHWIYLAGNTILILGAVLEGYHGGRLTHR